MLTVVIPTMWRYKPFVSFLNNLCKLDVIDEIILIDNDKSRTPNDDLRINEKVIWIEVDSNLFVNPSWNLGVKIARNQNVCIINDDVMVDFKLFVLMNDFMNSNKEKFGIAGIHPGDQNFNQIPFVNGSIDLIPWQDSWDTLPGFGFGFGTLFFVRKDNWVEIPEELKLYFGDNWAFETTRALKKDKYIITNCLYYSPNAQTCVDILKTIDYSQVISHERTTYEHKLADFKRRINEDFSNQKRWQS